MSEEKLKLLFEAHTGMAVQEVQAIPGSGSNRRYFRLKGGDVSVMGVQGTSREENQAFIALSRHFAAQGLSVPQVLAVSSDGYAYLQEDLGDQILFDLVARGRESGQYSPEETVLLCKAIGQLPRLQFLGAQGLDWRVCYPQEAFDARMIDFDLNYFKYCFLKESGLEFNESLLQDDFDKFRQDLLQEEGNTFLYRDFQARNVMIKDGQPWFIDYQGGKRGPIYYDVASFIWQARSRFPKELKETLIETYLDALREFRQVDRVVFYDRLRHFVLFRTLQVLGAYGFRGYFEKKPHFLLSIPYAIENLRELLQTPFQDYPYLNKLLTELTRLPQYQLPESAEPDDHRLTVHVSSFSFKKGLPVDTSGNGGGYIFDCRAVHNPGRYEFYRQFNGTDPEVIKFLEDDGEVLQFLESVYKLVDAHVERYMERGFTHLEVSFGCTGGQHRSVYCAEHVARHLADKYDIRVKLTHREMNIEKTL